MFFSLVFLWLASCMLQAQRIVEDVDFEEESKDGHIEKIRHVCCRQGDDVIIPCGLKLNDEEYKMKSLIGEWRDWKGVLIMSSKSMYVDIDNEKNLRVMLLLRMYEHFYSM